MENCKELIAPALEKVESLLLSTLSGSEAENQVNAMCLNVVKAGGKRLRPKLCLCAAMALEDFCQQQDEDDVVHFAAAVELLHTATLVHDDVIDKAPLRRGRPTINDTDGNHIAVLAGDYLFTKCFLCISKLNCSMLSNEISAVLSALVSGEINQLKKQGNADMSITDYEHTIYCKTGALFELASSGSAIYKKESPQVIAALKEYGKQLGIGFQITDDVLDYTSSASELGKPSGEDLDDGRITLPLILALKRTADRQALLKAVFDHNLDSVQDHILKTGALEECKAYAQNAADKAKHALAVLKDSPYRQALFSFADKAISRSK